MISRKLFNYNVRQHYTEMRYRPNNYSATRGVLVGMALVWRARGRTEQLKAVQRAMFDVRLARRLYIQFG